MKARIRSPRRYWVGAVSAMVVIGAAISGNSRSQAQTATINPRDWAVKDYRVPTAAETIRAYGRFALLCGVPNAGTLITGGLVRGANQSVIMDPESTAISCFLGAPAEASCEQLVECYGGRPETPGAPTSACDGDLLRGHVKSAKSKTMSEATVSCKSLGGRCYSGVDGAFCGVGLCEGGETYTCDGDSILSCMHGVRVRAPCGNGMTCGSAPGSGVVDCVPKGNTCTTSRCDGTVLHECVKYPFGEGKERVADCGAYGLGCVENTAKTWATCAVTSKACDPNADPICDAGAVKLCIAGSWQTRSCEQMGLPGSCQVESQGKVSCRKVQ